MKLLDYPKYGKNHPLQVKVCSYLNGNIAVQLITWEDRHSPEPWSMLTVNLDGQREKDCAFIDTNNNGDGILDWITEQDLAAPTGAVQFSGYCHYWEYHFIPERLMELDPEGYAEYLQYREEKQTQEGKRECQS